MGRCEGLKPYHINVPTVLKSGTLRECFTFTRTLPTKIKKENEGVEMICKSQAGSGAV
jgi:hypothetical protein